MVILQTMSDVSGSQKSKMAAAKTGNTYNSVCRPDSNEIPNANMFVRSVNPCNFSNISHCTNYYSHTSANCM